MNRLLRTTLVALMLHTGIAAAEPIDPSAFVGPDIVQLLVDGDATAILSAPDPDRSMVMVYSMAFANQLAVRWQDQLSQEFRDRTWSGLSAALTAAPEGATNYVMLGTMDGGAFADAYPINSTTAQSVLSTLSALLGG